MLRHRTSYIEDHDLGGAVTAGRRLVRRHLIGSLVAVEAIGVVTGAFGSRVTHSCGRTAESTQR
jgi:hypothetical protein